VLEVNPISGVVTGMQRATRFTSEPPPAHRVGEEKAAEALKRRMLEVYGAEPKDAHVVELMYGRSDSGELADPPVPRQFDQRRYRLTYRLEGSVREDSGRWTLVCAKVDAATGAVVGGGLTKASTAPPLSSAANPVAKTSGAAQPLASASPGATKAVERGSTGGAFPWATYGISMAIVAGLGTLGFAFWRLVRR
jgi:hypothetical protein